MVVFEPSPSLPSSRALSRTASQMVAFSSLAKRLGTSPALSSPLMSSTYDSSFTCVSAKRKTVPLPSCPAMRSTDLRSSRQSAIEYDLETSIWKTSMSHTCAASRVTDWRPEPPTPASSTLPRGICSTRVMRQTCSTAKRKSTSFIGLDEMAL